MLPNQQIGAPAAPSTPQSLSFQSDPANRASFKGFMSGLSNPPAPMPSPVMTPAAMPSIPSSMSGVDIFQPVQGFYSGGYVDTSSLEGLMEASGADTSAGQAIAEAMAERDAPDDSGGGSTPSQAMDRAIANTAQSNYQDLLSSQASEPSSMASRTDLQRGVDPIQNTATAGDALSRQMAAIEARSPIESSVSSTTQPTVPSLLNSTQYNMFGDSVSDSGFADDLLALDSLSANARSAPTAATGINAADALASISRIAELNKMKSAIDSEYMGTPAPRPQRTFVSPQIPVMSGEERAEMDRVDAGPNMSMASPYDMVPPKIAPQFDNLGAMGAGAFPAVPSAPSIPTIPADPNAPMDDFERNNGLDMMADLADRTTTTTLGAPGQEVNALEQLARRAQAAPGSFAGNMAGKAPAGIAGILGGLLGSKAATSMYNDIANKGYIPQYDSTGQIVATINPQTGQFGKGSVESRIAGYTPAEEDDGNDVLRFPTTTESSAEAEEVANIISNLAPTSPSPAPSAPSTEAPVQLGMPLQFGYGQVSSNLDNALSSFFNLLGGN